MQFKFDADQGFQKQAVAAIVDLFKGQVKADLALGYSFDTSSPALANIIDDQLPLLTNLREVQAANGIMPADELAAPISHKVSMADGKHELAFQNFTVEMETGTGKTYVYLRTAIELYLAYGYSKFIIVVPSVAVREGVKKTLEITHQHFLRLYDNISYEWRVYDSDSPGQVRQFATGDKLQFMVMTIDSFSKPGQNVIYKANDNLSGDTPIHLLQATHPILILDEPQNMETAKREEALANLNPAFALRYSATHREYYNLVHRLSPFDAYRQGLVKKIEVDSVTEDTNPNEIFIRLESVKPERGSPVARVTVHELQKSMKVSEKTVTLRQRGENLEQLTRRPEYAGYVVEEINASDGGYVSFRNGVEIYAGEARGLDREAIFRQQIRLTIEKHFRKQQRRKLAGIKVISLFFIDRVENYAPEGSLIKRLFAEEYGKLASLPQFAEWAQHTPQEVSGHYFAAKRLKGGEEELLNSETGRASEEDKAAYQLIMRDKERLLSFDEPTAFIFSHSALREGWDSPNVFQICTLNQTISEMKKRQEIGRGMRLAVNQQGERVKEPEQNVLTVIANQSYEQYVRQLQAELAVDYSEEEARQYRPAKAQRDYHAAHLRRDYMTRPEFIALWERIKPRTRYTVSIDEDELLANIKQEMNGIDVTPPSISIEMARVEASLSDQFEAVRIATSRSVALGHNYSGLNILDIMANLMESTTPSLLLAPSTLLRALQQMSDEAKQAMFSNPYEFATHAVRIIKREAIAQMIAHIRYEIIGEYSESQFQDVIETLNEVVNSRRVDGRKGASLYDAVPYDSVIERDFAVDLEHDECVKLYIKLPGWFCIPTPIGDYNPDWAIVMEQRDGHDDGDGSPHLYLVRETKSTTEWDKLRLEETQKIRCGARHFCCDPEVSYRVVVTVKELPGGKLPGELERDPCA